jgi:RNA polymerase sigma-70 factor (ECF subfamily)
MDTSEALNACLQRLSTGDPQAGDRILEICSTRLREMAHRMLGRFPKVRRHDDTDDVFQGAVLRLHRALGQMAASGQSPRSVMALAATQIRRELVDLARRNAGASSYAANHDTNVREVAGQEQYFVEQVTADDEPLDRWEQFHSAIAALPAEEMEVFQLAWYFGVDQETIAGVIGCSERTVRSRWLRAREAVKSALAGGRPE